MKSQYKNLRQSIDGVETVASLKCQSGTSLLFHEENENSGETSNWEKNLRTLMRIAMDGLNEDHFDPIPAVNLFPADNPRSGDN